MMAWDLSGEADVEIVEHGEPQRTIASPVRFAGVGLHSGRKALFSVEPAPADYGIRFDTGPLGATPAPTPAFDYADNFTTTAVTPRLKVQCVEHLMSCLHGLGIVNAHVQCLAGDEFPILDGSAGEICDALLGAGIRDQSKPCRTLRIRSPFTLGDDSGERTIACTPGAGLTVRAHIVFRPPIGEHSYEIACTPESYAREIAPARTFLKDSIDVTSLARLRETRLKGLPDPCPLIYYDDREILCDLRFPDETVRHKILDFMGDIFTVGMPIEGRFELVRPGHQVTLRLVQALQAALRAAPVPGRASPVSA